MIDWTKPIMSESLPTEGKLPAPSSAHCPSCDSMGSMLLVEDQSKYTPLEFVDGHWVHAEGPQRVEPMDSDEAVRMFCVCCGEYFEVPEGLCQ